MTAPTYVYIRHQGCWDNILYATENTRTLRKCLNDYQHTTDTRTREFMVTVRKQLNDLLFIPSARPK